MRKFIFLFLLLLVLFPLISAVPPVQSTTVAQYGLEIEANNIGYIQRNTDHLFRFRVYNASNNVYFNDDDVNCSFGIVNNKGVAIYQNPAVVSSGFVFVANVSGGNFSEFGVFHKGINCITDDGLQGGVLTQNFEVTQDGKAFDQPEALFYLVVLFTLTLLTCMFVTAYYKTEFIPLKVLNFYGAYIFIMIINYFLWTTTAAYISISSYLPQFFQWLFLIQLIALFPMMLGTIGYYFYLSYKTMELDKMMMHGVPEERRNSKMGRRK